jgi:hypothetical protein
MIGVIFSPKVEVVTTNHSPYAASQLNAGYMGKVSNTHVQARVKQGRRNKGGKNAEIVNSSFRRPNRRIFEEVSDPIRNK